MTKKQDKRIDQVNIFFLIIIVIGIVLRILFIDRFPAGLNCDEASAAYNAFSILKTMSDRYGNFMPVYMSSFGLGQSALFTYLTLPFVKIFGLNIISTRLPMAVISSISLVVFYKMLKFTEFNDKIKLFALLFFALNPWHLMKSRWGLDCNIFPDIVLIAVFFLLKYYYSNKDFNSDKTNSRFLYLSFVCLAISAYSYATSYVALSIFCIALYVYGIKTKTISKKQILISALIALLITWPLILFIVINFFDMPEVRLPFCTIPRLAINRMSRRSIISSDNVFLALVKNIFDLVKLLIIQRDGLYWNSIRGFGLYYLFAFPFFVLGIFIYIKNGKKRTRVDDIFMLWLASGIIFSLFLSEININRVNFVIIPIIYFIIVGFVKTFRIRYTYVVFSSVLVISFILFSYKYIDLNIKREKGILISEENTTVHDCFATDLESFIKYLDILDNIEKINLVNICREPQIYVLYYLKIDPREFRKGKNFNTMSYLELQNFGKWDFSTLASPDDMLKDRRFVYVVDKRDRSVIDENEFDIEEFSTYIIVRYKG